MDFVYKPYMIKEMGELVKELKKEEIEYQKRLVKYANLKKRRLNGEIIKPIDNYKIMCFC